MDFNDILHLFYNGRMDPVAIVKYSMQPLTTTSCSHVWGVAVQDRYWGEEE